MHIQKQFSAYLILIAIIIHPSTSITIECSYEDHKWIDFNQMSICSVQNNLTIQEENVKIVKVIGNKSVNGLSFSYKSAKYFPQDLEKFFKNLTLLEFHSSELREIKPRDMAPLVQLRALFLSNNSIHIIERDTFKYNNLLEVIWLNDNGIKYIDPFVFDHLANLRTLNLRGSVCGLAYSKSPAQVHSAIMELREIFSFPMLLWTDNQELTTELHKNKVYLEISAALIVFLVVLLVVIAVAIFTRKICRNNRVGQDDSRDDSKNTSKSTFFFEMSSIRDRLQTINFN